MKKTSPLRVAFQASLPVMTGYLVLGFGFGILMQKQGYPWWLSGLMSLCVYAGSMQYAAVELLTGGASLLTAALMTLMVNIRHLFYGVSMLEPYQHTGKAKPYLIFSLTDETFSLVCSPALPEGVPFASYAFWVSLLNQCYWVAGTLAGAWAGGAIPFNTTGIDFSMTALFVVIFVEQWEKTKEHRPALIGLGLSLLCLLIFGAGSFLIPAMVGIALALLVLRGPLEGGAKP